MTAPTRRVGTDALLDTGKVLAKGIDDEDIMFARPGSAVEYWEDED